MIKHKTIVLIKKKESYMPAVRWIVNIILNNDIHLQIPLYTIVWNTTQHMQHSETIGMICVAICQYNYNTTEIL